MQSGWVQKPTLPLGFFYFILHIFKYTNGMALPSGFEDWF
jgi:hypothetical protein